ncbi:MAG: methionine synthase, partial [Oscillospiraceae bacterium]|nr:methionine synthase [Oscillospiraceae bacterium]
MQLDVHEAMRYLGAASDAATEALVREMAAELERAVQPRYTYRVLPVARTDDGVSLTGIALPGEMAARMLRECDRAAVLVCTLGAGFETLLRAWEARDMARAVALDACGSAYVEAGCSAAEREIASRFPAQHLTDRFSPGYGD